MFTELLPILKSTSLAIFVSAEDEQLRVNIVPKAVEGQNPALATPLSLLASASELDEKLPKVLVEYVGARQSLEDTLESTKLIMEAAKQEAQAKANTASKKTTKPVQQTPAVEADGGESSCGVQPAPSAKKVEPVEELKLF